MSLIAREDATGAGASHSVALQRFGMAMARREHEEAVVDYVVALEAILLGKSDRELRHRFALNGAVSLTTSQVNALLAERLA
ncbi:MAG: hypothetical protein ACRDX8_13360, partial [Acidimicrobiales bacterium]